MGDIQEDIEFLRQQMVSGSNDLIHVGCQMIEREMHVRVLAELAKRMSEQQAYLQEVVAPLLPPPPPVSQQLRSEVWRNAANGYHHQPVDEYAGDEPMPRVAREYARAR